MQRLLNVQVANSYDNDTKVMEGIFVGPKIRQLIKDPALIVLLRGEKMEAWKFFKIFNQ